MPPPPKILDIQSLIGAIKIDREFDIKKEGNAYSHIAITAKIKIQLERIR
ncbi:hypothetical protein HpBHB49_03240 [Helicobacter pylori]